MSDISRRDVLKLISAGAVLESAGGPNRNMIGSSPPEDQLATRRLIVAVEESDSTVGFYDSPDGTEVSRIAVGFWPHEIALTEDGNYAFVSNFGVKDYDETIGSPGASISVLDISNFCEIDRLYSLGPSHYLAPHGLALNAKANELYVNVEAGFNKLLTFRLADCLPPRSFGNCKFSECDVPRGTHNLLLTDDSESLWVYPGPRGASRINPKTGKIYAQFTCQGTIRGLTFSADRKYLIASATNQICIVDPLSGKIEHTIDNLGVGQILYSAVAPDGQHLISPAVWESQILIINLATGTVKARLLTGLDPIHVAIDKGHESAYVSHGRTRQIAEIDLKTFKMKGTLATHGGPNGIALARYRTPPKRAKLIFGACLPLSGQNSVEGRDLRIGYQYWQELVNAAGGIVVDGKPHEVDIVYRDTQSEISPEIIYNLTKALIDTDHAEYLLGTYPSPPNLHCGKIANERGIPLVTASGAAEVIYDQGYKFVFGIMSSARAFLEGTLRKVLTLNPKPNTITFLSCDDPAASQDAKTTAVIAQKLGLSLIAPEVKPPFTVSDPGVVIFEHKRTDFDDFFSSLVELSPDLVFHTGHLPEAVGAVLSAKKIKFLPLGFAFSVGPAMPAFAQQLGYSARYMMGASMWSEMQIDWGNDRFVRPKEFSRSFFNRFSMKASYLAAGATACGLVYEDAFHRAGTSDGQKIRDALSTTELDTFYSHIEFDSRGLNVNRPLITIQLQDVTNDVVQVPIWPSSVSGQNEVIWPFPKWQ
jgi:ABC-type branched-subunit amino acid transport system substrate-binding protein